MNSIVMYTIVKDRGFKIGEFADLMGMTYKTFTKKMRNPDTMTITEIKRFAELLNVDWKDIVCMSSKII